MRRMFWLALGASAGGFAVYRASKAVRSLTPAGMNERLAGLGEVVRDFADDIRDAMTEREGELRASLGLDDGSAEGGAAAGGTAGTAQRKGTH